MSEPRSRAAAPPRRILLADADAFYVSVARLLDPEGAGKAKYLIVGGSSRQRGVVTSASYEARKFGVTSAMPMARAIRLCPEATVVPVPMEACGEKSREIREVLRRFTPDVEAASIDEFYLDMSGTERLYKDEPLEVTARRMREEVLRDTKLSVSIGGGTSRLVAKMAAGASKPGGVRIVPPGGEGAFLREFQLADIPMVGAKFQERLARYNLKSVDDALAAGVDRLRDWLGEREGLWLWDSIHGISSAVVTTHDGQKSISRDETFAEDIDDDAVLEHLLIPLVDRAASDLRDSGYQARTVKVRIRDWDFTDRQTSRTLPAPVVSDRAILRVCRELLARLRATRRVPARLLGVGLSNLVTEEPKEQLALLDAPSATAETDKDRAVAAVVDKLRHKLGDDAVALGRAPRRGRRRD